MCWFSAILLYLPCYIRYATCFTTFKTSFVAPNLLEPKPQSSLIQMNVVYSWPLSSTHAYVVETQPGHSQPTYSRNFLLSLCSECFGLPRNSRESKVPPSLFYFTVSLSINLPNLSSAIVIPPVGYIIIFPF